MRGSFGRRFGVAWAHFDDTRGLADVFVGRLGVVPDAIAELGDSFRGSFGGRSGVVSDAIAELRDRFRGSFGGRFGIVWESFRTQSPN